MTLPDIAHQHIGGGGGGGKQRECAEQQREGGEEKKETGAGPGDAHAIPGGLRICGRGGSCVVAETWARCSVMGSLRVCLLVSLFVAGHCHHWAVMPTAWICCRQKVA